MNDGAVAAKTDARPTLTLVLLTLAYTCAFVDRQIVGILSQPLRLDLGLTDAQIGWLSGPAFAFFYTIVGVPVARLADRGQHFAVVSAALALWSGMTALCGLAGGFAALFAARVGVGIGEAGCAAPAQALIANATPPERRATALALFSLGVPAGMMFGAIVGGWLAQALGWRWAFVGLGLPGLALAMVIRATLRSPPVTVTSPAPPPLGQVARALLANPAVRHIAAGATLASFASYGLTSFAVTLAVRRFELSIATAASGFGLVAGLGIGVGMALGGWAADRIGGVRGRGLVSAIGMVVATAGFSLALTTGSPLAFAAVALVPLAAAHFYFGPVYATVAGAVSPSMRASALALLLLAMNLVGLGLGPLAVGTLSDHLGGGDPALGLGRALRLDVLVYLWAALHFSWAARTRA